MCGGRSALGGAMLAGLQKGASPHSQQEAQVDCERRIWRALFDREGKQLPPELVAEVAALDRKPARPNALSPMTVIEGHYYTD